MSSHKVAKELVPGRVLLISHGPHINKLAILLSTSTSKQTTYKVLVLSDKNTEGDSSKPDLWYKMLSLSKENIFNPICVGIHDVITINQTDIWEISAKHFKIDSDLIIKDWEKRQMQRFRDDPPGLSCSAAIQELTKLTITVTGNNTSQINYLDFLEDLKINDQDLYIQICNLNSLKENVKSLVSNIQIPNFENQFLHVFNRKFLEDKVERYKFELSDASMSLYPDYVNRIKLLKELKYVDSQNRGNYLNVNCI